MAAFQSSLEVSCEQRLYFYHHANGTPDLDTLRTATYCREALKIRILSPVRRGNWYVVLAPMQQNINLY